MSCKQYCWGHFCRRVKWQQPQRLSGWSSREGNHRPDFRLDSIWQHCISFPGKNMCISISLCLIFSLYSDIDINGKYTIFVADSVIGQYKLQVQASPKEEFEIHKTKNVDFSVKQRSWLFAVKHLIKPHQLKCTVTWCLFVWRGAIFCNFETSDVIPRQNSGKPRTVQNTKLILQNVERSTRTSKN